MTISVIRSRTPVRRRQQYFVRLTAANGRILASSEKYTNLADAYSAAQLIAEGADRVELPDDKEHL